MPIKYLYKQGLSPYSARPQALMGSWEITRGRRGGRQGRSIRQTKLLRVRNEHSQTKRDGLPPRGALGIPRARAQRTRMPSKTNFPNSRENKKPRKTRKRKGDLYTEET